MRVEKADPERLRWEHELLLFLAEGIDEVVAPLLARDGGQSWNPEFAALLLATLDELGC